MTTMNNKGEKQLPKLGPIEDDDEFEDFDREGCFVSYLYIILPFI